MAKPAKKKSAKSKTIRNTTALSTASDKGLRDHVIFLLKGGGAHLSFADEIGNWGVKLAGTKVAKFPHTGWMLVEHMRVAQRDILEFSRNPKHVSPPWPEGYWSSVEAPPSKKAWSASVAAFKKDQRAMELLVANRKVDLFARIPWGDGQTILREALLVADHNAYHLGQLAALRKSIGI
jgi:Protein of unknown function (DUF664)